MSGNQPTSRAGSSSRRAPAQSDNIRSAPTNPGLQPQPTRPPDQSLNDTIGSRGSTHQYEEEDQDTYQEANTATDNILLPEDPDITPSPSLFRRQSAPKPPPWESENLTQSQNEAVRTLSNILTSRPTGNQTDPPTDRPSDQPSGRPSSSTKTVSQGEKTYIQVFGNAITELVNSHVIESPPTIRLILAHKDPELPISKVILQALADPRKNEECITGITSGFARLWNRKTKSLVLPWSKALENYHKASAEEQSDWPDQDTIYPLPLDAYARESTSEVRSEIKQHAMEALRKWRSPSTPLARIYPSERDWKEGLMIPQLGNKEDPMTIIFQALLFNIVKGIGEDGDTITRYFTLPHKLEDLQELLTKLRKDIDHPFFPLPKYGISTRLERQGMSLQEACQTAAIFKIELEACLLEIWSYINPRMSAQIFRRNRHSIWNLSKPFWKDETPRQLEVIEDRMDVSFLRDIPPHLTPRRRRIAFHPHEDTTIGDYDDIRAHKDYSIDLSTQSARKVRANIAAKHVGTSPRASERTPHVGRRRLYDSIMGPQHFNDSSTPVPPRFEATGIPQEPNAPEIRPTNDSIWIDELPGSQDSEGSSDDNRDNQYRPPFGDPNDPNDPGDGRPPG